MADYGEITAIRRATRLVNESEGANFSVLNFIYCVLMIALVIAGIKFALFG